MRRRAKIDANQKEIVEGLRKAGYAVVSLAECGSGIPDILIGAQGVNVLLEIKMPGGKLTKDQEKFHMTWPGQAAVAYSLEHALELLGRRPRI